jgi:DNA replication protein DnaC
MIDETPCPFGQCDGDGFVIDETTRVATPCRCRQARVERRRAHRLSAVIPPKYRGVSFDRPPVTDMPEPQVRIVRRFVSALDENLSGGRGLWLYGDVGTGKTTLAMIVSRAALDAGRTVAIYSLPRLLAQIRATFESTEPGAYVSLFERLEAVDLLHVDDMGAARANPWVLEQLYSLINARYEAERSVVITTNLLTLSQTDAIPGPKRQRAAPEFSNDEAERPPLDSEIGERTVSRLEEMCTLVPLYGDDARRFVA